MPKIELQEKKTAWIVSIFLGGVIVATAFMTLWADPLFDEYMIFALVITVFPASVLDFIDYRWKRSVDMHLPDLFRSIAQAQQTGLTLPQAVEETSKRNFGALTPELKRTVAQISWGISFEKSFQLFWKRVKTNLTRQIVPLVIEAGRSGGAIEEVFGPLGEFIELKLTNENERRIKMRPYVAIVYVAYFVFLFSVIILLKIFFVQMIETPITMFALLTPDETKRIFFHISIFQAFFGGLIAGKMGEGTLNAGLKHCVILLTTGYLALKFIA